MATLAGALFGAAAVLAGNWINRSNERMRAAVELQDRRERLRALVGTELIFAGSWVVSAHEFLQKVLAHMGSAERTVPLNMQRDFPWANALTDRLGADLLLLDQSAVDALVSLRESLAATRIQMEKIDDRDGFAQRTSIEGLMNMLGHSAYVLATSFERIAPSRQLLPPELASATLKRIAQEESKRSNPGAVGGTD